MLNKNFGVFVFGTFVSWGFCLWGFCLWGFCFWGFCLLGVLSLGSYPWGFCPWGFCLWGFRPAFVSDLLESILFKTKKYFFIHKNQFLAEKNVGLFYRFFFELLSKFSDFVYFDNFIEKSHQNITVYPVFIQKEN